MRNFWWKFAGDARVDAKGKVGRLRCVALVVGCARDLGVLWPNLGRTTLIWGCVSADIERAADTML